MLFFNFPVLFLTSGFSLRNFNLYFEFENETKTAAETIMLCWRINMADQGVHSAERGFVDDVSPGKLSDFTSIDCSES